jgi:hypothetical protein
MYVLNAPVTSWPAWLSSCFPTLRKFVLYRTTNTEACPPGAWLSGHILLEPDSLDTSSWSLTLRTHPPGAWLSRHILLEPDSPDTSSWSLTLRPDTSSWSLTLRHILLEPDSPDTSSWSVTLRTHPPGAWLSRHILLEPDSPKANHHTAWFSKGLLSCIPTLCQLSSWRSISPEGKHLRPRLWRGPSLSNLTLGILRIDLPTFWRMRAQFGELWDLILELKLLSRKLFRR